MAEALALPQDEHTKTTARLEVLCVAHMKRRSLYWIARLADIEDDPEW